MIKAELPKATIFAPQLMRHNGYITRRERNILNQHASGLLWFTGFSGAGKSTIAHGLERELFQRGLRAYVLDGDNVRHGINADLGFSRDDRRENIRRIVEISKLFMDAGFIVLASFISPYREDREFTRTSFSGDNFYEVYVKCSLAECEKRDPKGMYLKARQGIIPNYTGITSPYEEPVSPELTVDTEILNIAASIQLVLGFMDRSGLLRGDNGNGSKLDSYLGPL